MECPICKGDFEPKFSATMPFCSERCRKIDLGRWLGEEYSLPHVPDPEDDEEPEDNFADGRGFGQPDSAAD